MPAPDPLRVIVSQGSALVGQWLGKNSEEGLVLGLELAADLAGDVISGVVWSATPKQPANPGDLIVGAGGFLGSLAFVLVTQGSPQGSYLLKCLVNTTGGQQLLRAGVIFITSTGLVVGDFGPDFGPDFGGG